MRWLLLFAALAAGQACAEVHRCTEGGKTTFSDRPCAREVSATAQTTWGTPPAKQVGDPSNAAYSTPYGPWRGQVQFMAKSGTAVIQEAHAVVPLVLEIDPQGKVTGTGNGCSLKGIALAGLTPTLLTLDVTLSGCPFPGYNRQMTGLVALYKERQHLDFSLQSYDLQRRPNGYYELKGTLRR